MSRKIIITESDNKKLQKLINDIIQSDPNGREHIRALDTELNKADVLAPNQIPANVITMNSKVLLSIGGEEVTYSLVYPADADISNNRISILAPIGTAILGYREKDILNWEVPAGTVQIKIKKILYQPEAAGDFEL
ncbi:MAG: nucleoside diphosphate kinase regulator [Eubacteriales bacterium]|nr:nucleoside diphosphate kinase regulator [Eubacteriales bacterium]